MVIKPFIILKKLQGALAKKRNLKLAPNGGDWRSKSLALMLIVSTTLDGFYFANCVLGDALFENLISNNK